MNSVQQLGARSVMWDFVSLLSRKLTRISNVAVSYFMYLNRGRQRGQFAPGPQFKPPPTQFSK
jgi:hypothetical protein